MSTKVSDFYVIGGTLRRDAPSYVKRSADDDLYEGLNAGHFCYVLTSRQMGKSSLMVRTAVRLREDNVKVAVLDLTAVGQNVSAEQWYEGLLGLIGQQLNLEDELEDFWLENKRVGPLQRWMHAIREVVITSSLGRVVIFVDEIDAVRSLPFSTDEFFAGIREFYNRRTEDPDLERLIFCLLGVATPSDLIRETRTTPFNIGRRIELTDFTESEAAPLAHGLGCDERLGRELLHRILYWTGGHPYLTQRLCQSVAEDKDIHRASAVDRVCEELFLSARARERDDNLLFVRERMLRSEETDRASLLDLYLQVHKHRRVRDDETNTLVSVLRLSGVTRSFEGYLYERNRIYHRVFDRKWVVANMPDAELQRQRAAYRKGLLRAAAVAALILAVMGALAIAAIQQRNRAERNARDLRNTLSELRVALADAQRQKGIAQEQNRLADERKQEAEEQRVEADKQRDIAEDKTQQAIQQKQLAEQRQAEANRQRQQAIEASRLREIANQQRSIAEEQRRTAEQESLRILRILYAGQMNQAQQAWQENNIGRVRKILDNYRLLQSEKYADKIRGFEWDYLWRLSHSELSTLPLEQSTHVYLASLSGDRKRIAVVSRDNDDRKIADSALKYKVKILDVKSGQEIATVKIENRLSSSEHALQQTISKSIRINSDLTAIALSPDGTKFVTGHGDNTLSWWDVSTGQELTASANHSFSKIKSPASSPGLMMDRSITSLAFSPDGKILVSGSTTETVKLWDVMSQKKLTELSPSDSSLAVGVTSLAVSSNNKFLAVGNHDSTVKVYEINSQDRTRLSLSEVSTLKGHESSVTALAFSPDSEILATGSTDKTVKLWNMTTNERIGSSFTGHIESITAISFSPDGKIFATASADKTVRLWTVPNVRVEIEQKTAQKKINVMLSPQGSRIQKVSFNLFSTPSTNYVFRNLLLPLGPMPALIRLFEPKPLTILKGHQDPVLSVMFSSDSKSVITAGADNMMKKWAVNTQPEWKNIGAHDGAIFALAYSPDGKTLATGVIPENISEDAKLSTLQLWDASSGKLQFSLPEKLLVNSVAFSHDGKILASGGRGLKLWNVATGQELVMLDQSLIFSVAFSPDGKILAAGNAMGAVDLWDTGTSQKLMSLKGHSDGVEAVVFSPDGKLIATASHDSTVCLWEALTGREVAVLKGHLREVKAAAFSPDGSILATGGDDKTIKLWNVATKEEIATLEGHEKPIAYIAFSPDGNRIATASGDSTVKLWDVASRQEVASLKGHTAAVWSVAFSPDGKTIATGGSDHTVKLWHSK
jgi:WD40 repeat protein